MALGILANSSYLYFDVEASSHPASPPAESWVQVVGAGFGDRNNLGISAFHVFQGHIYAATNHLDNSGGILVLGPGPAQVWRSPDGQSWSRVTAFSPPLEPPQAFQGIFFMADSGETTPQYFYLAAGRAIYRSTNGTTWTQINGNDSGFNLTGNRAVAGLVLKETAGTLFLYAGTANDNGAQIWRIPFDATSGWEMVLDFASEDPSVTVVTYLYVWKERLYAGTLGGLGGAHIYTSDSGNENSWVKNLGFDDSVDPNNVNVAAIIAFKGQLYVSTQNKVSGGQLWRSSDSQVWDRVVEDGFGNPLNEELHRLSVAQGQIWVTTFTVAPAATQVWRSPDGFTFVQSNTDGFGDFNTTSGFPVITKFQGNVYWGGQNKVTGAQIWRTRVPFP